MADSSSFKHFSSLDRFPVAADGHGESIFDRLRNRVEPGLLKADLHKQLQHSPGVGEEGGLCLQSSDVRALDSSLTGGKGSSLAILNAIRDCSVPDFFCVSTAAFQSHFYGSSGGSGSQLQAQLAQLQLQSDQWSKALADPAADSRATLLAKSCLDTANHIRDAIVALPLSEQLAAQVKLSYARLSPDGNQPCAVRSSATTEDSAEASYAGQHDTFLHQCGATDILLSIRRCWASIFSDRAVEYRARNGVPHAAAIMCVVVQRMVSPVAVAGTAFSVEISTSFPAVHINASYGLGEAVVSGEVTGDEWLLDRRSFRVIKRVCGSKLLRWVSCGQGASGVVAQDVPAALRSRMCLPDSAIRSLASTTLNISKAYTQLFGYANIDTEFATTPDGTLQMLQARPVVVVSSDVFTAEPDAAAKAEVLLRGQYSLLGAASGKLKVILRFEDLMAGTEQIQPDDILVTTKTSNYFNPFLSNLRGIVTFEGSATAHPMLVGRERRLPVVCGVTNASEALLHRLHSWNGARVTVDGLTRSLYAGSLPLRRLTPAEFEARFGLLKLEPAPTDEQVLSFLRMYKRVREDSDGVVWVFNPNAHLSPVWAEIRLRSYDQRWQLVNGSRKKPLSDQSNPFAGTEAKVLLLPVTDSDKADDGGGSSADPATAAKAVIRKVADRLIPVARSLSAFADFSLEECELFHERCVGTGDDYMAACSALAQGASMQRWRAYVDSSARFFAAMWLSYFFRIVVSERLTALARNLGCSQLHYEALLKHLQSRMPGEDDAYKMALKKCALAMLPIIQGRPPARRPQIMSMLESIARQFRAEKETDITRPWPLEVVLHTVLESAYQLAQSPAYTSASHVPAAAVLGSSGGGGGGGGKESVGVAAASAAGASTATDADSKAEMEDGVEFFPNDPELHRWARLSVGARVWMSSAHHIKIRGQNVIRDELLRVARVCRVAVWQDILNCQTLAELEAYIVAYERTPNHDRVPLHDSVPSELQREHERLSAMRAAAAAAAATQAQPTATRVSQSQWTTVCIAAAVGAAVGAVLARSMLSSSSSS